MIQASDFSSAWQDFRDPIKSYRPLGWRTAPKSPSTRQGSEPQHPPPLPLTKTPDDLCIYYHFGVDLFFGSLMRPPIHAVPNFHFFHSSAQKMAQEMAF